VYPSGHIKALTEDILQLFALEDRAAALGEKARAHAQKTHDPEKNLRDLMDIYHAIQ
jgi:glycosyltransferase involved in cell wall biosynthesis